MKQEITNGNTTSVKTKYDAEYRDQIVEVWNSGAYETVGQCASSYGIKESTLHSWIGKARKNASQNAERDPDFLKLQKENARLKMELDILKKAAIYFATHTK